MVVLVVSLSTLFTVRISVTMESQPLVVVSVSLNVPAVLIVLPFQLNGSWLVQMVVLVVSLSTLLTVRMRVTMESQPRVVVSVSLNVPAVLIVFPFQLYGSWLVQMVVLVVSLSTLFTVNIRIAMESQPLVVLSVSLNVPAALIVFPFQLYGSWLVHIVVLVVSLSTLFTVNIKLIIESHPLLLVSVSL
jgi:hypothetical protein